MFNSCVEELLPVLPKIKSSKGYYYNSMDCNNRIKKSLLIILHQLFDLYGEVLMSLTIFKYTNHVAPLPILWH